MKLKLSIEGYEDFIVPDLEITSGNHQTVSYDLEISRKLIWGKEWTNSLGMVFLPTGDIMLCKWETRRHDYDTFVKATGRAVTHVPDFAQDGKHPVVGVNRDDAEEFCRWLTHRDRAAGLLPEGYIYRLPTDLEWSRAAGRRREKGSSPKERDRKLVGAYPWGFQWPPPANSGNFADDHVDEKSDHPSLRFIFADSEGRIEGYKDDFPFTAPVGSFPPDKKSDGQQFHDLAGNVWEWVSDDYSTDAIYGTLRGGSWESSEREELWNTYRYALPYDFPPGEWENGFRCALAKEEKP